MEHIVQTEAATNLLAEKFLATLTAQEGGATIIGLSGDLGSGKTTFVKFLARHLGIEDEILSPTFVIAKFYELPGMLSWSRLIHVDAYRIENPDELRALKWENLVSDKKHLIVVEWPEQVSPLLPSPLALISFRFIDETTRGIILPTFHE
jgi:tRNA threonylcarbamoyladenosine biosynthesis protein TsaE